jgi:hypothetical protein
MIRREQGKVYQTCGKIVLEKTMSETSDSIGSGDLSVFPMFSDVLVSLNNQEEKEKKKEQEEEGEWTKQRARGQAQKEPLVECLWSVRGQTKHQSPLLRQRERSPWKLMQCLDDESLSIEGDPCQEETQQ